MRLYSSRLIDVIKIKTHLYSRVVEVRGSITLLDLSKTRIYSSRLVKVLKIETRL